MQRFCNRNYRTGSVKSKRKLLEDGIDIRVVDIHTIKPIDKELIINAQRDKKIITIEDHNVIGGWEVQYVKYYQKNIQQKLLEWE